MKRLSLLSFMFFISLTALFSQDVQFPPSIVSAGGSISGNSSVLISRWRIGQVVVLTLPVRENELKNGIIEPVPDAIVSGWNATVYPNPVDRYLKIRIEAESPGQYYLKVVDLTGRSLFEKNAGTLLPGQVEELDFSAYTPGIYILNILPGDKSESRLFKIIKN